jgi:predicted metalloprotease with PDZ domain
MNIYTHMKRALMSKPQLNIKTKTPTLLGLCFLLCFTSTAVLSGDEYSEKHLTSEIGFLANKLLNLSGKDTYSIEVAPYEKPFIGICTDIKQQGLVLTCVTPGTQADKGGLKTGDIVTQIKGLNLVNADDKRTKRAYYSVVETMKTGDVIPLTLSRNGELMQLDIEVGAVSHPGYSLKISK